MLPRLILMTCLGLAAMASAQEPPPAKQLVLGKQIFYALAKDIREELKITEAQMKKIVDAFQGSLQVDGEQIMVMMDPSLDMDDCEKQAVKVLEEDQRKRLQEIWIQEIGAIAMVDDEIAKKLKLEDTQKKSVNKFLDEAAKELMDLFTSGEMHDQVKKSKAIREKASGKALEVLTEEQKKILESMKGKAFKRKSKGDGV